MNPLQTYELERPPVLQNLLLENPWPLAIAFAALAIVLLIRARQRLERRLVLFAALGMVLAVAVVILAHFVTTTRELLIARTETLLATTQPVDVPAFRAMFDPDATLSGPDGTAWLTLDDVVTQYQSAAERHGLEHHDVRQIDAQMVSSTRGLTLLVIETQFNSRFAPERATRTQWLFTWARDPEGTWRIVDARWLRLGLAEPTRGIWR